MLLFLGMREPPKGIQEEDCFRVRRNSGGSGCIEAAGLMQWLGYDYKGSGNQRLDVTVNEDHQSLMFPLPEGTLTPVPRLSRKKAVKGNGSDEPLPEIQKRRGQPRRKSVPPESAVRKQDPFQ